MSWSPWSLLLVICFKSLYSCLFVALVFLSLSGWSVLVLTFNSLGLSVDMVHICLYGSYLPVWFVFLSSVCLVSFWFLSYWYLGLSFWFLSRDCLSGLSFCLWPTYVLVLLSLSFCICLSGVCVLSVYQLCDCWICLSVYQLRLVSVCHSGSVFLVSVFLMCLSGVCLSGVFLSIFMVFVFQLCLLCLDLSVWFPSFWGLCFWCFWCLSFWCLCRSGVIVVLVSLFLVSVFRGLCFWWLSVY